VQIRIHIVYVILLISFFPRHGLIKKSQEINSDILEKPSSYCSLIETSFKEQLDKYLKKDNKDNLNKLQKITDDVKLLTKQLQLSINNNNNSSSFPLGMSQIFGSF